MNSLRRVITSSIHSSNSFSMTREVIDEYESNESQLLLTRRIIPRYYMEINIYNKWA